MKVLSHVRLLATPWTVAYQAPPTMGFSRQEYWSGLLFPSPGDLPNPGIEPGSPTLEADALTSEPPGMYGIIVAIKSKWLIIPFSIFVALLIFQMICILVSMSIKVSYCSCVIVCFSLYIC